VLLKCFHCPNWFRSIGHDVPKELEGMAAPKGTVCTECNWHKCPFCEKCYCDLSEEGCRVAEAMQKQYEQEFARFGIEVEF